MLVSVILNIRIQRTILHIARNILEGLDKIYKRPFAHGEFTTELRTTENAQLLTLIVGTLPYKSYVSGYESAEAATNMIGLLGMGEMEDSDSEEDSESGRITERTPLTTPRWNASVRIGSTDP
ncbi:hypothetical protein VTJ49DRAFT_6298 [Mycothermus thermophilus]|uniref:Uncharacterized protein n=1 Tax=Humicola insolens TaxID=85995 RepID=A0ABR3V1R5_HUMIN